MPSVERLPQQAAKTGSGHADRNSATARETEVTGPNFVGWSAEKALGWRCSHRWFSGVFLCKRVNVFVCVCMGGRGVDGGGGGGVNARACVSACRRQRERD